MEGPTLKKGIRRWIRRLWRYGILVLLVLAAPFIGINVVQRNEARRVLNAAIAGNVAAQFRAGQIYSDGIGVDTDYAESARWYRSAAEHGNALAQAALANIYDRGMGVPRDEEQAFRWYLASANSGWAESMIAVSYRYMRGNGVDADLVEAFRWVWLVYAADSLELKDEVYHQGIVMSPAYNEYLRSYRIESPRIQSLMAIKHAEYDKLTEEQKEQAKERARAWRPISSVD